MLYVYLLAFAKPMDRHTQCNISIGYIGVCKILCNQESKIIVCLSWTAWI